MRNALPQSPLSLWLAEYGPYEPSSPLAGDAEVDVAIVGGGFTGVATAHTLLKAQPGMRVAVLEHEYVGYGASGRNGSFSMTVVGLGIGPTAMLKGKAFVRDAHRYMERAVDGLEALIRDNQLQCDYTRPGFLRMATTPGYVKRIRHDIDLAADLGIQGIEWLDRDAARAKVNSELYLGAWWEPRLGLLNPAKLVREEKRLALQRGAQVYEHTPVVEIQRGEKFRLKTPGGNCDRSENRAGHQRLLASFSRAEAPPSPRLDLHDRHRTLKRPALHRDPLAGAQRRGRRPQPDSLLPHHAR